MHLAWGFWEAWFKRKEVESAAAVGLHALDAYSTSALYSDFPLSQGNAEALDR